MLCKDLKPGMLLTIASPERKGWFNIVSHERVKRKWIGAPPKFTIGPDVVSLLVRLDGVTSFVKPGDVFVYVGKKKLQSRKGETKTFRIVFANGKVGYLEGRDAKFLEPI